MGAGASTGQVEFESVEDALAAGKTQGEIDIFLVILAAFTKLDKDCTGC